MLDSRILIFVGTLGSGKTEWCLNLARFFRKKTGKVAVIDLDIINPYFVVRQVATELQKEGIRVVSVGGDAKWGDLPLIASEAFPVLGDKGLDKVLVDVGGDAKGAIALAQFADVLANYSYKVGLVLNPYRPQTSSYDSVRKLIEGIELSSKLKCDFILSNPNLGLSTTFDDVLSGHEIVLDIASRLKLPVVYVGVPKGISLPKDTDNILGTPLFILERRLLLPWERG